MLRRSATPRRAEPTPEVGESGRPNGSPPLDFWTRYWEWPLHKFSDWLGVRVADKVICVSPRVRDEAIIYYGADQEKLAVVENGVNVELFSPRPRKTSSAINRDEVGESVGYQILYVGALQPRKNVHLLIEALSKLPGEYQLTIVGKGDRDYEKRLHSLATELDLGSRVTFKGYIEYPKLPAIYQKADIFVIPSSYEGLPKVILEALACGVPVLASGFDIKNSIQGLHFLDSLDPKNIALKVIDILELKSSVDIILIQEKDHEPQKAKRLDLV